MLLKNITILQRSPHAPSPPASACHGLLARRNAFLLFTWFSCRLTPGARTTISSYLIMRCLICSRLGLCLVGKDSHPSAISVIFLSRSVPNIGLRCEIRLLIIPSSHRMLAYRVVVSVDYCVRLSPLDAARSGTSVGNPGRSICTKTEPLAIDSIMC